MKRALVLLLSALVLTLVAVGCTGSSDSGSEGTDKDKGASTKGKDEDEDSEADAPEVVWQEASSVGFTPRHQAAGEIPTVTIYDDGTIYVEKVDPEAAWDHPAVYQVGTVEESDLETFLSKAEGTGLFSSETDLGTPDVADVPVTSVTLRTAGKARTITVDGLRFDETNGGTQTSGSGISEAQSKDRTQLRQLLGQATDLGGKRKQYRPDRVRATIVPAPKEEGEEIDEVEAWPGPAFTKFPEPDTLSSESCLVIEGKGATTVYDAARKNETIRWKDGDDVRSIVVSPLLPGQEGCPPSE